MTLACRLGLTGVEMAQVMGCAKANAAACLLRAVLNLRAALAEWPDVAMTLAAHAPMDA